MRQASKQQGYRRLRLVKHSATERMPVPKLATLFNLSDASVRSDIQTGQRLLRLYAKCQLQLRRNSAARSSGTCTAHFASKASILS